ncbi:ribosome biogenesis protein 15 [Cyclospora cayetanensis]|uniref:RNA recognition motif-containing protein n=2 Tax=Cyclospora cayetanensis TaxID=88456 RepID=A0A1D3D5S0_9EIME|nr:ribosome biogenesis protein 15 [Cyclospora cayetanensis]OEH78779.1 RNA recognition motif-containing protein [Cyclospora cayetanensis]
MGKDLKAPRSQLAAQAKRKDASSGKACGVSQKPKKAAGKKKATGIKKRISGGDNRGASRAVKASQKGTQKKKVARRPPPESQSGRTSDPKLKKRPRQSTEIKPVRSDEGEIPRVKASQKRVKKKTKRIGAAKSKVRVPARLSRRERQARAKRGVIYIAHLPLGFLEPQLKAFFGQFGEVTRVRLFRSRKTAHSKGYAFVEFALSEVADIAAKAMDKYRMFGRTLVCRLMEKGQVEDHVFKNCDKPFRHINWQSIAAAKHNKPEDQRPSAREIKAVEKRMKRKLATLKEMGIDLELPELEAEDRQGGHFGEWMKYESQGERNVKKANVRPRRKSVSSIATTAS